MWRTKDINIGGKNPSGISFASIGNQIQFVDTIKYFQQSLAALANSLTGKGKIVISRECEKFFRNDAKLSEQFLSCSEEEKKNGFLTICRLVREQCHMN